MKARFRWAGWATAWPGLLIALLELGIGRPASALEPPPQRMVFLGDSITDGNTYPLWLHQALGEANLPAPVCINAGVAGDTAHGMRLRLQRDVLSHHPTLVALSVGINDILHHVQLADYEKDVTAMANALQMKKVPLLILTTTILGPKHAREDAELRDYNSFLRRLAQKQGYRVAEVNERMSEARSAGRNLLEEDQVHLNVEGYRVLVRAVLDALGYQEVPVPQHLKPILMPGIVSRWRIRVVPNGEHPLDKESVLALKTEEAAWKTYTLPEQELLPQWWQDQERQRGFAMSLEKQVGPGKSYQGVAFLEADRSRPVFLNTGADLQTIWLNGQLVYRSAEWRGWHAGRERVPVSLQPGRNRIVIETGGTFFLSVTDSDTW